MSEAPLYLVTGGCGFIGSHLCEALLERGARVRVLDNLSSGHLRNIEPFRSRVEFIEGDVRDLATVRGAVRGARHVYHEAALVSVFESVEHPDECHEINLTGTLNLLRASREFGVRRLVLASTAAAYGNAPELPKRETMTPQPESPYAVSKVGGEHYLRIYASLYGLETVALRYFNVYGPRQDPSSMYSGVISKFASDIRADKQPAIFGDGKQTRDFVFVKDVVQANLKAMHDARAGRGEVFNVATGRSVSLLDLLAAFARIAGRDLHPVFGAARRGDIRESAASIESIRAALDYAPQFTLEQGLAQLWAALDE